MVYKLFLIMANNKPGVEIQKKEYSLIGKIGSFKLQILSSSLSALDKGNIYI